MRNTLAIFTTNKPLARRFRMEFEFRNVGFYRGKTTLEAAQEPIVYSSQSSLSTIPGIKVGTRYWKNSALATALITCDCQQVEKCLSNMF